MEYNWLWGLVYGLLGGLFEFLPVSSQVHQEVLTKLAGLADPGQGMTLAVHIGALTAVTVSCRGELAKISRERKLASQPPRRRRRQPDIVSLAQLRLLKTAAVPLVLSCVAAPWIARYIRSLWQMALLAILCGILVLLPEHMSRGNKDARGLSPLDAILMGLAGIGGAIPGLSRVAAITSVGSMRGADRSFTLEFTYLLLVPALGALCLGDMGFLLFGYGGGTPLLPGILACIASFGASFAGIRLMRFLAVKDGYENLAYYNLGLALFTFILYLIG